MKHYIYQFYTHPFNGIVTSPPAMIYANVISLVNKSISLINEDLHIHAINKEIQTTRVEHIHPSQHPGSIQPIKNILCCYRDYWFVSSYHQFW